MDRLLAHGSRTLVVSARAGENSLFWLYIDDFGSLPVPGSAGRGHYCHRPSGPAQGPASEPWLRGPQKGDWVAGARRGHPTGRSPVGSLARAEGVAAAA
eukprot:541508-Heterocapsa_arctica.AAC.1